MDFKYIYGPVPSWRLGSSLGVDLLSQKEKVCSFDCIYCQLGKTKSYAIKRKIYVSTKDVVAEIKALPKVKIDYITFSGRGEPTLARNLGQAIQAVKRIRKEPVAVLTNASLLYRKDVREDLALADLVAVKLDASSEKILKLINQPAEKIKFSDILKGIKKFRKEYHGKLALQIMFVQKNKKIAKDIAKLAECIRADEIQINTPKRPSPVKPLSKGTLFAIKRYFCGMNVISLYDKRAKKTKLISAKSTILRRGKVLE
ncbi:MAG: radical SAM protein [Candidatus Omnitrophica bacterium]|nr:radical SAM protein [Candidatus Omnitrophota bacterium]